jgi:pilus assembly protein CpaE
MSSFSDSLDSFGTGGFSFEEPAAPAPGLPTNAAVVVVDSDGEVRDYLANQIGGAAGIVGDGSGIATAAGMVELELRLGVTPVVAVLGPSCVRPADLAYVERWSRTHPEVAVVLVASQLSTELLQRALRAGVKDVLAAPVDRGQLMEAVNRAADALRGATGAPAVPMRDLDPELGQPGRVITVFSTKGGSGKSVVATNLAVAMARRCDKPVALVDAHLQFGDVAVMLKLQPRHTVVEAVQNLEKLDAGLIRAFMSVHEPSGLLVLPAPLEPAFADQISGAELVRLIELLRSFCGTVVVDTPAFFNEVVLSIIEASDDVILVAGMDIPNIKNVRTGLNTLAMLATPKEKLHLVLNRSDSKVKLDIGEVERTLNVHAVARIPSDVVVPISVNRGSPVVLSAPRSRVARAFEGLATTFLGRSVAPPARRKPFG